MVGEMGAPPHNLRKIKDWGDKKTPQVFFSGFCPSAPPSGHENLKGDSPSWNIYDPTDFVGSSWDRPSLGHIHSLWELTSSWSLLEL